MWWAGPSTNARENLGGTQPHGIRHFCKTTRFDVGQVPLRWRRPRSSILTREPAPQSLPTYSLVCLMSEISHEHVWLACHSCASFVITSLFLQPFHDQFLRRCAPITVRRQIRFEWEAADGMSCTEVARSRSSSSEGWSRSIPVDVSATVLMIAHEYCCCGNITGATRPFRNIADGLEAILDLRLDGVRKLMTVRIISATAAEYYHILPIFTAEGSLRMFRNIRTPRDFAFWH